LKNNILKYKIEKMKKLVVLFFAVFSLNSISFANEMLFIEKGGFEKAKLKAKEEGKMLLLDFYASWCTPCKWMDETTFKDLEVRSLLDQKYIAVKVNIDDFEGFELKSKFDIRFLPTILIFNPNGQMIERVEETLGSQKMKTMLSGHAEANASFVKHKVNSSPRDVLKKEIDQPTEATEYVQEDESKTLFRMQMGVFSTFEGANAKSLELQNVFVEKITIIEHTNTNGKILYKVVMGEFSTSSEARSFKDVLETQFNMKSIVL
jgi:thiol-disulfide isomerase/thioredoxin